MQRFLIALFISLGFLGIAQESKAQWIQDVSGYLLPGKTKIFYARTPGNSQTDTIYRISGYYNVSGRLVIQPGAEVHFLPGGRLLDSAGGKIIANGFERGFVNNGIPVQQNRILMRGISVNNNSYEWGHILVLPGADSVFFANVRFAYFRKKESIDFALVYGNVDLVGNPALTNSLAIIQASNGSGGVMTTFSAKTWLYDIIVDSCQAIYRGGAFAFLQAPSASYFPNDDGRIPLANHQVRRLLIRDTRVLNETAVPKILLPTNPPSRNPAQFWPDTGAYGGAIYIAARNGSTISNFRADFLGYTDSNIFHLGIATSLPKEVDTMHFERCTANNLHDSLMIKFGANAPINYIDEQAYGGAIYVGDYSALTTALIGCFSDSAIAKSGDQNMKGGAIYVSKTSADPSWLPPPAATSRNPGLSIIHRGSFVGNVAGLGGAIYCDWQNNGSLTTNGPSLNIDGDNVIQTLPFVLRDSGIIQFLSNTAYYEGGAIFQNWYTYITGYLSPNTTFPMRWDSVEMRVRFFNNCAGIGGGSVYLNPNSNPDYQIRRAWHKDNFVNPLDSRINRPTYEMIVKGGGAEFLGTRDSTFAVEYLRNYVINGNGGAVYWNMGQSGPVGFAYNKFMVENNYNASNPSFSNGVLTIAVTNGGSGYVAASTSVSIVGGGGIGATATANVVGGVIQSITVTNLGLFYTSVPSVLISGVGINGAATATLTNYIPQLPFDPRELTRFEQNMATFASPTDSILLLNSAARGGGLYVNINNSVSQNGGSFDTLIVSRGRFEQNQAFTGSAIHSDNYRLNVEINQTLIANNFATSTHNATADLDAVNKANPGDPNTGATIYADLEGPLPQNESNSRGNAIYDNRARFIIREPDGPHGYGGVDTLRGNFFGETGPDIITNLQLPGNPIGAFQRTFFIDYYTPGCYTNVYEANRFPSATYAMMPIGNPVPDTLLFEGRVYDIFDKGLDIKTIDYSNRRLAISEAFSLGLPTDIGLASKGRKGLHRWTRDIFTKDPVYLNKIMNYQIEFTGPHPIGYPLFLQADIDSNDFNRDRYARNYTTVFVFNETTQEYVRVNLKEETQDSRGNGKDTVTMPYKGRLDFVPDSTVAQRHPQSRARVFWSPSLIRPSDNTYLEIARAAKLEDSAALDGRAYNLSPNDITNTVAADSICARGTNINSNTTLWYAGERYHTMPVRPGDVIDVFSRTQLWKYGFAGAKTRGLSFVIGDVLPPFFTGDVAKIQNDSINANRLFVHEDSVYKPFDNGFLQADGTPYPIGTNPNQGILLRIGGYDVNNFYDPRWLFDPYYSMLDYSVTFANMDSVNFRAPWWMRRDTVRNVNPTVGSNGYVQLFGTPHNPDVVPGGEPIHVVMTNFPPNFTSEHGLLGDVSGNNVQPNDNVNHPIRGLGLDSLKLSMWIFPPYMNCPEGFLTDTLCVRRTSRAYDFKIFVMDSLPRFLDSVAAGCNGTANLTDRLRFDFDLNTDDELEDSTVGAVSHAASWVDPVLGPQVRDWDFRYGRTSYKSLVAPLWMQAAITDPQFKTKGIIHVDIDAATALTMITPIPQVNGELSLDTVVAVQADDGHSGLKTQRWHAQINVAPHITTDVLPHAKEDFDYSTYSKTTDTVVKISQTDPNFGDSHTWHLVYKGQTEDVYKDSRYKAGKTTLVGTTPLWLQINPTSGALSGVPGQADAPHSVNDPDCGVPDTVLVVVEDQCGLTDWKWIQLNTDSTNHPVHFLRGPKTICITNKTQFCDSLPVVDKDLTRMMCADSLSFVMAKPVTAAGDPVNFTGSITPTFVKGKTHDNSSSVLTNDTAYIHFCGTFNVDVNYFSDPQPVIFKFAVSDNSWGINNTDSTGHVDTLVYKVYIGDVPTFECAVYVSNKFDNIVHPNVDIQRLCFGAGPGGHDSLDVRYCEFEIPPAPYASTFDARWELPVGGSLKGSLIDIRRDTAQFSTVTWQIRFNSGSDNGAFLFPIKICWRPSCLDSTGSFIGNFYLVHGSNPNEFSINMKTGAGPINPSSYQLDKIGSDSLCLSIFDINQKDARIIFVPPKSDVTPTSGAKFALEQNYPNPFNSSTRITFSVAERSSVRIEIYDLKGSLVRTLVAGETLEAGEGYPVIWDGTDNNGSVMASGTYICKMVAGDFSQAVKMTLNK